MRAVQLDRRGRIGIADTGRQHQRTGSGGPDHGQPRHDEPAFGHRANRILQRDFESGSAHGEDHQRADEPAHRQAHQRAGRDDGADDEMNRYEGQQQRPPPVPPAGGQPGARNGQHRGQHRDPPGVVQELGRQRVEPIRNIEVPSGCGNAVAADRQRERGEDCGGGVGAQQFPLPANDQPDQDHEWQRQDGQPVDQVHHVGLRGCQDSHDLRDGFLQGDPARPGDHGAGDHGGQEHRGQDEPQDVVGPAGHRLQQAAGHADLAPVDSHGYVLFDPLDRAALLAARRQLNRIPPGQRA